MDPRLVGLLAGGDGLAPGPELSALPGSRRAEPGAKREGRLRTSLGSEALVLGFTPGFERLFAEEENG